MLEALRSPERFKYDHVALESCTIIGQLTLRACNKTPIGSRRVARSHTPVVADDGVKRKLLGPLGLCARMAAGWRGLSCEAARAVYSNTSSAAYTVYREDQWQRRSKHTELES